MKVCFSSSIYIYSDDDNIEEAVFSNFNVMSEYFFYYFTVTGSSVLRRENLASVEQNYTCRAEIVRINYWVFIVYPHSKWKEKPSGFHAPT